MDDELLLAGYLTTVGVVFGAILVRVWIGLSRTRQQRLSRLARKLRFEAVPTGTPVEHPAELARERATLSIDQQFTVTRRFFVPLILLVAGAAASLPFLSAAPANLVSVLVTAVTVVAGVASRPFLENAMAGLVISSSRLINLGDTVKVADMYGTVEDITTTHTSIKLWDWRRYVIPNSKMLSSDFLNYSLYDRYIWASVEIHVAYTSDLERVREMAIAAAEDSAYFTGSETPEFWVMELQPQSVRCIVAAWTSLPSEAWMLGHEVRRSLANGFRTQGIRAHVGHVDLGDPSQSTWARR